SAISSCEAVNVAPRALSAAAAASSAGTVRYRSVATPARVRVVWRSTPAAVSVAAWSGERLGRPPDTPLTAAPPASGRAPQAGAAGGGEGAEGGGGHGGPGERLVRPLPGRGGGARGGDAAARAPGIASFRARPARTGRLLPQQHVEPAQLAKTQLLVERARGA